MKRKHQETDNTVIELYKKIKPITWECETPVFYAKLQESDLFDTDFRVSKPLYMSREPVTMQLSVLTDIKVVHPADAGGQFRPTIEQVILQIPKELVDKTVAFEMVYNASSRYQKEIFKSEWDEKKYVSVIRLYKEKAESEEKAKRISLFPLYFESTPIGMTDEQAKQMMEIDEFMLQRGLY